MSNADRLTDTLIHIEQVLENNIPKGYHEIVREYVIQQAVATICSLIVLVALAVLAFCIIKWYKKYVKDDEHTKDDKDGALWAAIIGITLILILVFFIGRGLVSSLQRVLSPNWYILQQLLHK